MDAKPLLLTMGDACGIGPEILVKAFIDGAAAGCAVVGEPQVLRRAAQALGQAVPLALIEAPADLELIPPGCLAVLRPDNLPAGLAELPWGRVHAPCGAAAARCIEQAAQWLGHGQAVAMVTAPLHKEALAAAGIGFPGHTEMLRALAAKPGEPPAPVRMMLANGELRVVLVTSTSRCADAIELVSFDSVLQTIRHRRPCRRQLGAAATAHCRGRAESACRRGRPVRRRGAALHRAGDRGGVPRRGHRCERPLAARHGLHARAPAPGRLGIRPRGGNTTTTA